MNSPNQIPFRWRLPVRLAWLLVAGLMLTLFLIFPDGRFVPPWARWVAGYSAAVQAWRLVFPAAYLLYVPLLIIPTLIAIVAAQMIRYRRVAAPPQRQQIKRK